VSYCCSSRYQDLGQILCQGDLSGRRNTLQFTRVSLFLRHRGTRSQSEDDGDGRIQNKHRNRRGMFVVVVVVIAQSSRYAHHVTLASTSAAGRTIHSTRNSKLGTFISLSCNGVEAIEIALECQQMSCAVPMKCPYPACPEISYIRRVHLDRELSIQVIFSSNYFDTHSILVLLCSCSRPHSFHPTLVPQLHSFH
jgi:hypothetical protein